MRRRGWTSVFFVGPAARPQNTVWRPPADVYRTPDGWLIKFDLAGVKIEDVSIDVADNHVTVRGVRKDCTREEGCSHYSMEINYSRFERTIELPGPTAKGFRVETRDGILMLRLFTQGNR